jgi:dienelactone hydrolase
MQPRSFELAGSLTRRAILKVLGVSGCTALEPFGLRAQEPGRDQESDDPPSRPATASEATNAAVAPPYHRFPRVVHEYYVRRVREIEQAANARRAALRSRDDAERYVRDVRERIARCFGPFPERTPLNARITSIHKRDGFQIENVIFDSRPGFPVTANLYVPTDRTRPLPCILGACGHSATGKAGGTYGAFAQGLVRQGYVTLIFDPPGQGERVQVTNRELKPLHGVGTAEHAYLGNQMVLVGENLPTWFSWDGIRALDYLLSRPEVDPSHVGVTGNSGGGTQTTWLCGLDRRITMAAPGCFVTTFRRNLENEHSADPEQYPWHALAEGLDHSDFLAALAPRPLILMGQEKDYFDARGFEEAAGRLRRLYRLLGAEQNFASFLGDDYHGFSRPMREAMYAWFNKQTGMAAGGSEPNLGRESLADLQCTRRGQVAEMSPVTIATTVRELSQQLRRARPALAGKPLAEAIQIALKLRERVGVADYRKLEPNHDRRYPRGYPNAATYAVETEPGIHALVYRLSKTRLLSRVPRDHSAAVLYLAHRSADYELRTDPQLGEIISAEPNAAIFAGDVRGIGETRAALSTNEIVERKASEYLHAGFGLMLDDSTPSQRTFDALRLLDWLAATGHQRIHLVARGFGAIPATFAAVLHDTVDRVTLLQPLTSYSDIAEANVYQWPLSALVPSILQSFDLPDCYRDLTERKQLKQIDPVGPRGYPI